MTILKIISVFLLIIVIANMILFALRKINAVIFWIVIICSAIMAYYILPKIKK